MSSEMELSLNLSEDENCTFITASLLEHTDNFDEWLDKNGVRCIITSDCISENMINNQLDPLLNQVKPNLNGLTLNCLNGLNELNDLHGLPSDENSDDGDITLIKFDNLDKLIKVEAAIQFNTLECKSEYLETKLNEGLNVVFESELESERVKINLVDNDDIEVWFEPMYVMLADFGTEVPVDKVPVTGIQKVSLSDDLKASMVCLILDPGLRLFICPQPNCDVVHMRLGPAKIHALVQIGHKPFKCDQPGCTWAFYNSFRLRRHQDSHTKQKDYMCVVANCNRKFKNIYNLNIHIKSHDRPANLPCTVKDCTAKFQTSRTREKHFKTHEPSEAPYACQQENCNRSFFLLTGLSSHARTHMHKESELRCDYPNCGKVFDQPCRLKEHARQHTGQRPYSCNFDQCKWTFTTASKLKRHQSTHTQERKFHCTIGTCNKSFLRSEHLKDHTLTHIGQRSFNCEHCSASFLGKSSLYMHVKKSHPEQNQCARSVPYTQPPEKPTPEMLLERAIQSLGVPSDMILGAGLLPEEPLELLENVNFSTVNLRDLD